MEELWQEAQTDARVATVEINGSQISRDIVSGSEGMAAFKG